MQINERFEKLLQASPSTLSAVDNVLMGREKESKELDTRLLTFSEAARCLNLSRTTIWRMCRDNRLRTVMIREGCRRVPMEAIKQLIRN